MLSQHRIRHVPLEVNALRGTPPPLQDPKVFERGEISLDQVRSWAGLRSGKEKAPAADRGSSFYLYFYYIWLKGSNMPFSQTKIILLLCADYRGYPQMWVLDRFKKVPQGV